MKGQKSKRSAFTLLFDSVTSNGSLVHCVDHHDNQESTVKIAVDDSELSYRVQKEFPSIIADLIDLAVAIHASDRLIYQNLRQHQVHLHIVLPVRHPEILNQDYFQNKLSNLMEWTTGNRWIFEFSKRVDAGRDVEQQFLIESNKPHIDEVALWSGGLDALAGLYTRLKTQSSKSFMLFGSGSNDNTYARQKQVFHALNPIFPGRLNLCRVPVRFSASKYHSKNKISRARGIVFMMLGSAHAYLMGNRALNVYENGIGAINLPYRKSAIGLDHSRSVHPLTLLQLSNLMSELIGEEFRVQNPFVFRTKGQMCQKLSEDQQDELSALTISCDSPHRKQPTQCGYCSSCILRKQALSASQIKDKSQYIVPHGMSPAGDIRLYLQNMLVQVKIIKQLLGGSDDVHSQWISLTERFPELDDIVDRSCGMEGLTISEMRDHLIHLYLSYVSEWEMVESQIAADFMSHTVSRPISQDFQLAIQ